MERSKKMLSVIGIQLSAGLGKHLPPEAG